MPPHVSVVIATYQRPEALKQAVASVFAQTMADIEVVVGIEQGDQASLNAIEEIGDARVRAVVNPVRGGPGVARDLAARTSTAPWIAFLDDDDSWAPDKLERQLAVADDTTIVTCLSRVVTAQGTFVRPGRPYDGSRGVDEWLFDRQSWTRGGDAMLQTSSLLMPRAVFDVLGFGHSRHEEWELVIRATRQHGYRLVSVPEVLVTYQEGHRYSWQASLPWVEAMTDVMPPAALAGFCLNSATQGIRGTGRNRGFLTYMRAAFRLGKPTAKQLFAFFLIWAVPHDLRWRLRQQFRRLSGR